MSSSSTPGLWQRRTVEANLRSRVITGCIAIPILIFIIGWGHSLLVDGCFLVLTIGALIEYFAIVFPDDKSNQAIGIAFGIVLSLLIILAERVSIQLIIGPLLIVLFSIYLFMSGGLQDRLLRLAWTLLGGLYIGILFPQWILLFRLPHGRSLVFFVLSVIMSGDTCAYFVGRRFGRTKLAPVISPGKTMEGAIGYVFGSVLGGVIAGMFLTTGLLWIEIVVLSAVLSILGQLGDLFESWIKRVFTVKDSGTLLPGHGGLLDRLDSLVFPAVITTTYLTVMHL
jgi:phosphatidate cytidylyltransferase